MPWEMAVYKYEGYIYIYISFNYALGNGSLLTKGSIILQIKSKKSSKNKRRTIHDFILITSLSLGVLQVGW